MDDHIIINYQCSQCGGWHEGAALHLTTAPRDRYGRLARDYGGPKFCSTHCRDHYERW